MKHIVLDVKCYSQNTKHMCMCVCVCCRHILLFHSFLYLYIHLIHFIPLIVRITKILPSYIGSLIWFWLKCLSNRFYQIISVCPFRFCFNNNWTQMCFYGSVSHGKHILSYQILYHNSIVILAVIFSKSLHKLSCKQGNKNYFVGL